MLSLGVVWTCLRTMPLCASSILFSIKNVCDIFDPKNSPTKVSLKYTFKAGEDEQWGIGEFLL
jgi:hypothetical protein